MPISSDNSPESATVGLIQMRCAENRAANWERAGNLIAQAAAQHASIACLPELFAWPYPCQTEDHQKFEQAESIPGPTTDRLTEWAAQHNLVVVGSVFERRGPGLFHNTAVVVERNGAIIGTYRKMHIPDDPHYFEKFYFTPGDLGFRVFDTSAGRIGVAVCWDQWFPEAARIMALSGAQLLFYPTAIGWLSAEKRDWGESQCDAWETSMRAHAIANGVFVAATNRTGVEGDIEFWGRSFCCDPYGQRIAHASQQDDSELILARCDYAQIETARTHWPFLRDRRIDAYQPILQRWLD